MIIKNFKELATNQLRKDALLIMEIGLRAINTQKIIFNKVKIQKNNLIIENEKFNLNKFKRIFFIGIGKAALESAKAIEKILKNKITKGIALDVKKGKLKKIKSLTGSHPFPTKQNILATKKIIEILKKAEKDDLIISVISGGGSALLCSLPKATCEEESLLTQILYEKGASIEEINTIRKHISDIKGGNFAKLAYPAHIISLIFSDTPGCALDTVASGPTIKDPTTIKDAQKLIEKYKLPKIDLFETPKNNKYFKKVKNILVVCNLDALNVMHRIALNLGYKAKICGNCLNNEAKLIGKNLIKQIKPNEALLAGGETFVYVKGNGKGGRNQELVLGALRALKEKEGVVILSVNSDGIDNTDAAGAIADIETIEKAKKFNLDFKKYLDNNDSYNFFKKTDDLVFTGGPTGTNIADLIVVLRK